LALADDLWLFGLRFTLIYYDYDW